MRILICDTDPVYTIELKEHLDIFFRKRKQKVPEIRSYDNGEALLQDSERSDIIFMDIALPGIDGITVGYELKRRNKDIIIFIISSDMTHLDDAMRFQVFRYLSKPIDYDRLYQNLEDAIHLLMSIHKKIIVETREEVHIISSSDIISVEALDKKVTVHTRSRDYLSVQTMKYWTDVLIMKCFFRSHRSFIVNLKYIIKFDHSLIYLKNHQTAYLTRRKYTELKNACQLYTSH